jgi:hypothetical protein
MPRRFTCGRRIATIEFFGHKGVDVAAVRAALPFHEGDELSEGGSEGASARGRRSCNRQAGNGRQRGLLHVRRRLLLFIGIPGGSYKAFAYDPAPTGHARVSTELEQLDERLDQAIVAAVRKGGDAALEDDSKGYALMKDPEARSLQLTAASICASPTSRSSFGS